MPDTKTAVPIGRTPFLGENPRPAKMFLDTGIEQVAGHASREGHWGWDGASLETVSAIAHDPLGYKGGINLYEYVGDSPLTRTDPTGLEQAEKTYWLYVCVRSIDVKGPGALGGHVFIILDCGSGPQVFRGGPSDGNSREGCKCKNQLVADSYPYQVAPNPQDTPPDIPWKPGDLEKISCRKYPIRTAADCEAIRNCFNKTISLINKACLEYKPVPLPVDTGTNSNAVASWLLRNCMKNPPLLLPGGKILPGWPTLLPGFITNPKPDNKVSKCCGGDGSFSSG